ncbi:hypothetical protein AB1K83_09505 [Sporosarcina sp. 179-K 3D1 HS]|uniref:hypothetical protein n=1 Tax=Sporosarcina sp. 179-K 3D1 HS TaxID=3232169 RepID=UPI00399F0DD9
MFKKALPLVLMSGLVLGACNLNGNDDNNGMNGNNGNNGAVPNNNETPMENLDDRTGDWTPDLNGNNGNNGMNGNNGNNGMNGQTGPDLDGIDNGNDNRVRDGIIDNGDTTTTPRGNMNGNNNR